MWGLLADGAHVGGRYIISSIVNSHPYCSLLPTAQLYIMTIIIPNDKHTLLDFFSMNLP